MKIPEKFNLKEKNYSFHIDVVGDGEMDEDLKTYAEENRLTDVVTFHGFLPPNRVRQMMEEAHIYLLQVIILKDGELLSMRQ